MSEMGRRGWLDWWNRPRSWYNFTKGATRYKGAFQWISGTGHLPLGRVFDLERRRARIAELGAFVLLHDLFGGGFDGYSKTNLGGLLEEGKS